MKTVFPETSFRHSTGGPTCSSDRYDYPDRLNAAVELTDAMVARGFGDRVALIGNGRRRTYKELADWTNRLAHTLVDDLGVRPGNRVLIRSANNPAMVACWLAATKVGAVVVNTMPLLRAGELTKYVDKAEISHALCDIRLMDELAACAKESRFLTTVVGFDGTANHDAELDRLALDKPVTFDAVETSQDDVALIGFTSGSTGDPKGTMHFHRDLLIIADGYAAEVLGVTHEDIFIGSPPLAFTFGTWRAGRIPAAFRRCCDPAGERRTAQPDRDDRALPGHCLFYRAHGLSCDAGGHGRGGGSGVAAGRRVGWRDFASTGL
jgi:2-aminobenzoate-CoA ligase